MKTPATQKPRPAGFWLRLLAYGLDTLGMIMSVYFVIIYAFIFFRPAELYSFPSPEHPIGIDPYFLLFYVIALIVGLPFASALFVASRLQATPGKLTTRLLTVDALGNRLSFGRALAREFLKIFSFASLLVGFFLVAFTKEKKALHDILAGTRVVRLPPRVKIVTPPTLSPSAPTTRDGGLGRANQKPAIARIAFVFAGIGAIPVLGWPFGLAALIWGLISRKAGSKRVAVIASICTVGLSAMYALIYFSIVAPMIENPERYMGFAKATVTQLNLTRATCHIEIFQSRYGRYPNDLDELFALHYEIDVLLRIDDLFGEAVAGERPPHLIYQKDVLGHSYSLYSVGLDGRANTEDDIHPPEGRPCPEFQPLTATPKDKYRLKPKI